MFPAEPFKWRHFQEEIILLNVRWYCRYSLSYRDLEEMMGEQGVDVDHSTINRWVLDYAPELDKRIRPNLKPTNDSWKLDETYIKSGESGSTSIEPSTQTATPSISCSSHDAMPMQRSVSSARCWAMTIPRTHESSMLTRIQLTHQHSSTCRKRVICPKARNSGPSSI